MPFSNFPKGFSGGITIQGMPIAMLFATSQAANTNTAKTGVYFVDSTYGADGNDGTYQKPLATSGRAWALASANDIIMLKPNHTDNISSATDVDGAWSVAGVSVIGLGVGTQRPTITLDTATTATVNVSAANIAVRNVVFTGNFAAIASLFTLTTAKGFTVSDCVIQDTSSSLGFLAVITTSTTSNAADQLSFVGNKVVLKATTGAVLLASVLGTNDMWTINDNFYISATTGTGAVIPIAAGKILTNLEMNNNKLSLQMTTGVTTGILITTNGSTNSGWITRNLIQSLDATTEILVTASSGFLFSQNYYSAVSDLSGYLLPAADA